MWRRRAGARALLPKPLTFLTVGRVYLLNLIRLVCYLIYILILRNVGMGRVIIRVIKFWTQIALQRPKEYGAEDMRLLYLNMPR
jgi:hypothetical protein